LCLKCKSTTKCMRCARVVTLVIVNTWTAKWGGGRNCQRIVMGNEIPENIAQGVKNCKVYRNWMKKQHFFTNLNHLLPHLVGKISCKQRANKIGPFIWVLTKKYCSRFPFKNCCLVLGQWHFWQAQRVAKIVYMGVENCQKLFVVWKCPPIPSFFFTEIALR